MTENKRGGKRDGSGRKPKAPTTTINFRVPVDKVDYLKPLVSTYIKGLLNPDVNYQERQEAQQEIVKPKEVAIKKPVEEAAKEPTMAELLRQMKRD